MSKNSLYASAAYPALPVIGRNADKTDPAGTACCPGLAELQRQNQLEMQALRDWVNKRLSVIAAHKYLYRTSEAKAALGVGTSRLYDLINNGTLDARRFGKLTLITAESIEQFIAALPPAMTPTRAKIEHDRWSCRSPQAAVPEGGAPDRWPGRGQPTADLEDNEAE